MGHFCLINPPGIKTTSGLQMHTPNPPIGLAYVAAAVRQAGHRVTVIDATGEGPDQITPMPTRPDILIQGLTCEEILECIPPDTDLVGFGCTFSTLWPISRAILWAIHKARPDVRIVAGGEHASALPEHVLETSPADVCVIGEGEQTVVELLAALEGGRDLSGVRGIAYRNDGEIVRTEPRPRIRAVDEIPWPAWDLFPIETYIERHQFNGVRQGRAMPILGTRGCPYRCTFCSSAQMWTTVYRTRDVGRICDEIEFYIDRYQVSDIHFQDLTAIVSKKWILSFCRELLQRNLRITWQLPSGTRCEAIEDEVCRMLAATGCRNMSFAPESGSPEVLESMQKRVDLEALMESIRAALRHRLNLSCFIVPGVPAETPATLRETLRFIRRLAWIGVQDIGIAKFVPYPGSVLFKQLLDEGRIKLNDDFFLSPIDNYSNKGMEVTYTDALSFRQLNRWMVWMYVSFYLLSFARRPMRTARVLLGAMFTGREETRYAKWFRDVIGTRRKWRRAARQAESRSEPASVRRVLRAGVCDAGAMTGHTGLTEPGSDQGSDPGNETCRLKVEGAPASV